MSDYDQDMMADLAAMDEEFVEAEPAERRTGGNNVPDGNYQARIDRLYFDRSRDGSKILLKWELIIAVGPHEGEPLTRNNMTSSPDNLRWLKADLLAIGLDTTGMRLSDIPAHLEALLDLLVEVNVKRKGTGDDERVNVYINRVVERDVVAGDVAPAAAPAAANPRNAAPARNANAAPAAATSAASRTGGTGRGLSKF